MKVTRLLALGAIAALVSACSGGGGVPTTSGIGSGDTQQSIAKVSIPSRTMVIDGVTAHVLPARGVTVDDEQGVRHSLATSNLVWNGGPVQPAPKIYVVFWGSKWTTGDGEYQTLTGFFSKEGGGGWDNTVTQYSGSNGTAGNPSGRLAGTWIDTADSVPSQPAPAQWARKPNARRSTLDTAA